MIKIADKINLLWAAAVSVFSTIFGVHWYLFASFLVLNIIDYITGIFKARYTKTENSNKGAKGIIKKVGYWIITGVAFFLAYAFEDLGGMLNISLEFTSLLGWFVLAAFIINEIRSIIENLVMLDVYVPSWLVKGLKVANDKINNMAGGNDNENRN